MKDKKIGNFATAIPDEVLYGGKIPPHSRELEQNVLGGMFMDSSLIDIVSEIIQPKHFYVNANGIVFQRMLELRNNNEPVDLVTVSNTLQKRGELDAIGGPYYLAELSTAFSSQESIAFSAKKILENWIRRDLILLTYSINEQCYNATIETDELLEKAQTEFYDIAAMTDRKTFESVKTTINDTMIYIEEVQEKTKSGVKVFGVPSGYDELDAITGGFQKSELIIIAGRPSHGKTALALNFARNASIEHDKNVGVFSIEMSKRELALRLISLESSFDMAKLKTGKVTDQEFLEVTTGATKILRSPSTIYIDDSSPLSLLELRSKARRMKLQHNIDMIIIDYLQLMELVKGKTMGMDRHLEIAYLTRGLKQLAKELDIPVIALSQLSRKVEERQDKRPQLSDLRESGAIEQDADVILFIHRPEVYMKKDDPKISEYAGLAEVITAKQRNGPIGLTKLTFLHKSAEFVNRSNYAEPEYYNPKNDF